MNAVFCVGDIEECLCGECRSTSKGNQPASRVLGRFLEYQYRIIVTLLWPLIDRVEEELVLLPPLFCCQFSVDIIIK